MEEPNEPTSPDVGEPTSSAPEVLPPATAEVPAASPYPPGYAPGPPPPAGPPPGYGWTWGPTGAPGPPPPRAPRSAGWLSRAVRRALVAWIVAGVLAATVVGLSVALATSSSPVRSLPFAPSATPFGRAGFPGPAAGGVFGPGVIGTVASVSSNSFTVNARSGATVTVDEQSSTTYYNGATPATSSIVTQGATVAVSGSRSGNTVTATRVTVIPAGGGGFFGSLPSTSAG